MFGDVIKIENPRLADALRDGDPALLASLNLGKASVATPAPRQRAATAKARPLRADDAMWLAC